MDEEKKELDALSLRLPRYQPVKDAYNRLEACKVDWTGKELGMLDNKCISISINHSFTSIAIERDPLCFEPAQSGEHMCRAFFPRLGVRYQKNFSHAICGQIFDLVPFQYSGTIFNMVTFSG